MADNAKDKRAAVLEKIKALKAGRASDGPTAHDADAPGGSKGPKRAPKQTGPSHRPQGG